MTGHRILTTFIGLLCVVLQSLAGNGDVLDQQIRLPKMKGTVYTLLNKVSELSGHLFIYDSKLVNNDAVVKIKENTYSVRQAIYEIIGDKTLLLRVIGKHILIMRPVEKSDEVFRSVNSSPNVSNLLITGLLKDKDSGEPIPNASVFIPGTSIGNITNKDGTYRLILPDSLKYSIISFSHVWICCR